MKKLFTVVAFLVTLSFSACTVEEEPKPECETNSTAWILAINTSSNPYRFYVDDVLRATLSGNTTQKIEIKSGSRRLKAIQVSGYAMYPTEVNSYPTTESCKEYSFQFPQ
jgi:hypothetical protein